VEVLKLSNSLQNRLDLKLSVQSVSITTNDVSSNPVQARCTQCNIML